MSKADIPPLPMPEAPRLPEVFIICSRVEREGGDADSILHLSGSRWMAEELLERGAFADQVEDAGAYLVLMHGEVDAPVNSIHSMVEALAYYDLAGGPALDRPPSPQASKSTSSGPHYALDTDDDIPPVRPGR